MEHVELGATGREISRIGLGAMPLSLQGRPDRPDARRVIRRAVELGVTLIDTADSYCLDESETGHNERLIRDALEEVDARGPVMVATKGGMVRPGGRWVRNARPEHLRRVCDESRRALGVDRIDLYQLHAPDPEVPFEESVGTMAELQDEGKVRWIGLSNVSLDQIRTAEEIVPVESVQNRFNPWHREAERTGVIEYCYESRITFIPYSPLGGSRRVQRLRESDAVSRIARDAGCSPEELVLAWVLTRSPTVAPIPGASRERSIESSVRALEVELDEELQRRTEEAFQQL